MNKLSIKKSIIKELYDDFLSENKNLLYNNKYNIFFTNVSAYISIGNDNENNFYIPLDIKIFRNFIKYLLPNIDIFDYLNLKDDILTLNSSISYVNNNAYSTSSIATATVPNTYYQINVDNSNVIKYIYYSYEINIDLLYDYLSKNNCKYFLLKNLK